MICPAGEAALLFPEGKIHKSGVARSVLHEPFEKGSLRIRARAHEFHDDASVEHHDEIGAPFPIREKDLLIQCPDAASDKLFNGFAAGTRAGRAGVEPGPVGRIPLEFRVCMPFERAEIKLVQVFSRDLYGVREQQRGLFDAELRGRKSGA